MSERPETPDGYKTLSEDTDYVSERAVLETWRTMTTVEKAELLTAANRAAHQLSLAGLRMRYPNASEEELDLRAIALRLDRETMVRVYGWDPDVMGL